MAKMRLIKEIFEEIKTNDPNTAITMCGLRRMVKTGVIPSVQIGRKRLINYDNLINYLDNINSAENEQEEIGVIRQII